ncbi:MAG: alkaline phosphatase family protein [Gemmatimonadota bacterium]
MVLIVVDQLPYRLLERYDDLWTGGFRRLRDEGRSWTNLTHDHAVTETAPGHASLSTGTHPSRHGIVANGWLERDSTGWRTVENIVDGEAPLVSAPEYAGGSPERLLQPGLADWIRQVDPDARIASVAGKDRAAVLLAGRATGFVYWYDARVARFVTSAWYAARDPGWLDRVQSRVLPPLLADSVWESTVPAGVVERARPDAAAWEGDGVHTTFPHRRDVEGSSPGLWLARTPDLDLATLAVARAAVEELQLGGGDRLDYLAVGLSQTDRVGHAFGPLSQEQLDNLLRLDAALGAFLGFLESAVPDGRLLVALTSDHGVLDAPEWRASQGLPGRRLDLDDQRRFSDGVRGALQGGSEPVSALVDTLRALDWIGGAWPRETPTPDTFAVLERNAIFPGRYGSTLERYGVGYRLTEGTLDWGWPRGTQHGSPYHYDRHVPFVLWGAGLDPGLEPTAASAVDVAPTLATWMGVAVPDGLDGGPLLGRRPSAPRDSAALGGAPGAR